MKLPWTAVKGSRRGNGREDEASSRNPFSGLEERPVQHCRDAMRTTRHCAFWLGLTALAGCDEAAEPEVLDPADVVVAERSNASLKATVNLAHVADIYHANDISQVVLTPDQVRALAVTSAKRLAQVPEVPSVSETIPGYEAGSWYAILTRAGTPTAIIDKLNREVTAAINSPAVNAKLVAGGVDPEPLTPEQLGAKIRAETQRWGKVVKAAGIKPQ